MGIPLLGRLSWTDHARLAYALAILVLDRVLRAIWWLLPWPLIQLVLPRRMQKGGEADEDPFTCINDTVGLLEHFGYGSEEHVIFTADGYFLLIHRVLPRLANGLKGAMPNGPDPNEHSHGQRLPVLLVHGTMLSSDIWLVHREKDKNLPLHLADLGYDVWLANRRGNRYCTKHVKYRARQAEFWDWSLDEVALYDLPAIIGHIREQTGVGSVATIGFSQGSAELLAGLSLSPVLNRSIALCICLGAMSRPRPHFLRTSLVSALVHASPDLLFLFFGRRQMLRSVLFWQSALPASFYGRMIESFLRLLFGWDCGNIDKTERRQHMFLKMYSYCSVKTVAHWFQMLRSGRFQMFDDAANEVVLLPTSDAPNRCALSRGHAAPLFPLHQIATRVALFNGARDTLADPEYTRRRFAGSRCVVAEETIEGYEHLDFLMARDIDTVLFPRIDRLLGRIQRAKTGSPGSSSRTSRTSRLHSRQSSDLSLGRGISSSDGNPW